MRKKKRLFGDYLRIWVAAATLLALASGAWAGCGSCGASAAAAKPAKASACGAICFGHGHSEAKDAHAAVGKGPGDRQRIAVEVGREQRNAQRVDAAWGARSPVSEKRLHAVQHRMALGGLDRSHAAGCALG